MDLKAEKLNLITQIVKIQNESLINAIKGLLEFALKYQPQNAQQDFWDELSDEQKLRLEQSMTQVKAGKVNTHEEVMQFFRKKYSA
jgi:inactivated superfamily I helicase